MLNQIILVGRLVKDPEIHKIDDNKNVMTITVAVPRSFKNIDGKYETDFINCILWDGVAKSTQEYCKKGDVLGVRGRLQTRSYEHEGELKYVTEVIAEKVTFLSSKRQEEE